MSYMDLLWSWDPSVWSLHVFSSLLVLQLPPSCTLVSTGVNGDAVGEVVGQLGSSPCDLIWIYLWMDGPVV